MIQRISNKLKTLALADAILEQEWEYRYFSYNSRWSDSEEMGSLRDGSGGEWFLWLSGNLAGYKCLSPEDGIMADFEEVKKGFPAEYTPFLKEPAFSMEHATCIWYLDGSDWRKYGKPPEWLISLDQAIEWDHKDYSSWAREYYEREIDPAIIEEIFNGMFNEEIAKRLNPHIDIDKLREDIVEIGKHT